MANAPLRSCPTCGTRVPNTTLGLRDYRWVSEGLPGKLAPMDLDFVLESSGQFLCVEFKQPGQSIPLGQRITLRALVNSGWTVWTVWHRDGALEAEAGLMDTHGDVPFVSKIAVTDLATWVNKWLKDERR